jgi:hypothetical protein
MILSTFILQKRCRQALSACADATTRAVTKW